VIDLEGDDDLLVLGETSRKRRNKGKAVVVPGLTTITDEPENETLKKLRSFKQFDTVVDTSDHHYLKDNSSMKQVRWFSSFFNSFEDVLCFSSNPNYMDLYITYFLSRIQRNGLKKSRKSGRFWRSICRVSTVFLILNSL
jgi:hypothetical protein